MQSTENHIVRIRVHADTIDGALLDHGLVGRTGALIPGVGDYIEVQGKQRPVTQRAFRQTFLRPDPVSEELLVLVVDRLPDDVVRE